MQSLAKINGIIERESRKLVIAIYDTISRNAANIEEAIQSVVYLLSPLYHLDEYFRYSYWGPYSDEVYYYLNALEVAGIVKSEFKTVHSKVLNSLETKTYDVDKVIYPKYQEITLEKTVLENIFPVLSKMKWDEIILLSKIEYLEREREVHFNEDSFQDRNNKELLSLFGYYDEEMIKGYMGEILDVKTEIEISYDIILGKQKNLDNFSKSSPKGKIQKKRKKKPSSKRNSYRTITFEDKIISSCQTSIK